MSDRIEIEFPGGARVDARVGSHRIRTDQPESNGGSDSAPSPFDLFLASLGTCAGFYALRFCQQREIDTDGLGVTMAAEWDPEKKGIATVTLEVSPPPGFPEKYEKALLRSVDQCSVKRHLMEPPELRIQVA